MNVVSALRRSFRRSSLRRNKSAENVSGGGKEDGNNHRFILRQTSVTSMLSSRNRCQFAMMFGGTKRNAPSPGRNRNRRVRASPTSSVHLMTLFFKLRFPARALLASNLSLVGGIHPTSRRTFSCLKSQVTFERVERTRNLS